MFRLEALSAAIREAVPPALVDLFAALTTLGDPMVLVGVVAVLYWLVDDRQSTARLVGITLVAVAVTISLKEGLALPRPPAEVRTVAVDPGSWGFPSGHAVGATVVYGGAVLVFDRLRTRPGAAVATTLVAVVALSRVVIGVHYLGDVVAGVGVGCVVLGSLRTVEYRLTYPLAALAVLPGVVVTGGGTDAVFTLGASLGASAVALSTDLAALPVPERLTQVGAVVALGTLPLAGTVWLTNAVLSPVVTLLGGVAVVASAMGLPAVLGAFPDPMAE